jgi:hypothetical protein
VGLGIRILDESGEHRNLGIHTLYGVAELLNVVRSLRSGRVSPASCVEGGVSARHFGFARDSKEAIVHVE